MAFDSNGDSNACVDRNFNHRAKSEAAPSWSLSTLAIGRPIRGLDLVVWSMTHGMACLLVEGLLPVEGIDEFIESVNRLVLADTN